MQRPASAPCGGRAAGDHRHLSFHPRVELNRSPTARPVVEQVENVNIGLVPIFLAHVMNGAAGDPQNRGELSILSPFVCQQQDAGTCNGSGTFFPWPTNCSSPSRSAFVNVTALCFFRILHSSWRSGDSRRRSIVQNLL